jgi:hypothetical protein
MMSVLGLNCVLSNQTFRYVEDPRTECEFSYPIFQYDERPRTECELDYRIFLYDVRLRIVLSGTSVYIIMSVVLGLSYDLSYQACQYDEHTRIEC